ncbi:MAG: MBL fold metallo-hydrolase [Rhodospirillales bacterium]|nr:MBL fold metallo-hydrolase [Rhodospirillales bacterium]
MSDIPFDLDFTCEYAAIEQVATGLRRIVARNPSKFGFKGTGTYIVGEGRVAVIDAGPEIPEHIGAILDALSGEEITHQLITHTHLDHSPASRAVKEATGAPIYGFGPHGAGRFEIGAVVESGGDMEFTPDEKISHGDIIEGDGWSFECVHTPGHTSNHICFAWREAAALFTGDHVMGWSTTVVSPPDGDMAAYMASLNLLLDRSDALYYPTHGGAITDPQSFVRALIAHRQAREVQIMECLSRGVGRIKDMVDEMYVGLDPALIQPARRSVFAHIIAMTERGDIACEGELKADALFQKA